MICGELAPGGDRSELAAYFQRFIRHLQQQHHQHQNSSDASGPSDIGQHGSITGLLLIQPTSYLHVIESSTKTTVNVMTDLLSPHKSDSEPNLSSLVQGKPKLLLAQEDALARFFPTWSSKILDPPASREKDVDPDSLGSQEILKTISEVCVNLLSLGSSLSSLPKSDVRQAVDEILEKYGEYTPRNTLVTALAASDNVTYLSEWVEAMGPVNLKLEGDLVYPAPKP
ncbi:hypothetical protein SeLEV6574_g07756 [Synchytrium endobioticum]|nr:hypothetical protein SeLEV6574_g07756 [Synchytrium endobioticum]